MPRRRANRPDARGTLRRLGAALIGVVGLAALASGAATAQAHEFDLTGTLDCGVRSGRACNFADWSTGPTMAVFTKDISGNLDRVVVDASWVRSDLVSFGQDDFVWFTVSNQHGPNLQVTGVIEHRCNDGIYSHGQVNQGQSDGERCYPSTRAEGDR